MKAAVEITPEMAEAMRPLIEGGYIPEPNSGCWLWLGGVEGRGYGAVHLRRRQFKAHRVAYVLSGKPIPAGLVIDHKCNVPICVNPDHLEPVTNSENVIRAAGRRTTCRRNHLRIPENIMVRGDGERVCKLCVKFRVTRIAREDASLVARLPALRALCASMLHCAPGAP